MKGVFLNLGSTTLYFDTPEGETTVAECIGRLGCESQKLHEEVYILCNGKRVGLSDTVQHGRTYHVVPRTLGGKGGFGSMLRAIGAQIEKTTNREACRDLSGRRMRDVNNEKNLREWMAKASEREKEKQRRRQERRERLRAVPAHKFEDPKYHEQKQKTLENLDEAVQIGLQKATVSAEPSTSGTSSLGKRKAAPAATASSAKKSFGWIGVDLENCSDLSSDDSGDEAPGGISHTEDSMEFAPSSTPPDENSSSANENSCPAYGNSSSGDENSCPAKGNSSSGDENSCPAKENGSRIAENSSPSVESSSSDENKLPPNENSGEPCPNSTAEDSNTVASKNCENTQMQGTSENTTPLKDTSDSSLDDVPTAQTEAGTQHEKTTESNITENKTQTTNIDAQVEQCGSMEELQALGLDTLKLALQTRGLKCGGTLEQRAERLWSVRGMDPHQYPPALLAKPPKKKK